MSSELYDLVPSLYVGFLGLYFGGVIVGAFREGAGHDGAVLSAACWPFELLLGIAISPFLLAHNLGKRYRLRQLMRKGRAR